MIPYDRLNVRAAAMLMEYLREEINRSLSERRPLEEKWLRYQRMYKAIPDEEIREFPFYGAANIVLPVIATDVDTIFSRLMGVIFTPENLWSCRPLRDDAVQYAPRLQEFLRWAQGAELDVYGSVGDWILELTKLGTGVLKQRYRRDQKLAYEFRETPMGPTEQFRRVMVKDSPVVQHVSLYDFLVPAYTVELGSAPWCGERLMLNWNQIQSRVRAGIYQATDRLAAWHGTDKGSWINQQRQAMDGFRPSLASQFELWEVWTDFDISGMGEPVSVVCTIHLPTMTYLRVDYNPFFHQEKPYSVARYLRQEKRFYGIGLCEMLEMFQEEGTAMHRQRLDNGTLANSTMMKAKKGIGIKEDEPIFPGRWFLVDEMDSVQPMQMGSGRYDSTVPNEQLTMSYATRRTGVNDYVMGSAAPNIGYAALGTNVLQHQEAAKRFDQSLREVRDALGETGRRVVELYQQFNQNGKEYTVLGPKDGEVVHQVLQFPLELIRHSIAVEVTATSASLNKEVEIRTNTILLQMVTQFYAQLMQGMQLIVSPELPPQMRQLAYQMVIGGVTMMRRVLDSYNIQDIDTIIPQIEEILGVGQQQLGGMGVPQPGIYPQPSPNGGGIAGAVGLLQASGMGAVQPRFG